MSLLVRFWTGWIKSENMNYFEWYDTWKQAAQDAEKEGCELVVFKIPNKDFQACTKIIEHFERTLQEKFPESKPGCGLF